MGEVTQKIVKVKKNDLLKVLNEAYAEEWLAYYQYWLGAKLAKGFMRDSVAGEFEEHAKEEHGHAEKLAERIIQLGGTPVLSPAEWDKVAMCKYDAPKDECAIKLLKDNIKSERCAIQRYQKLAEMCDGGKDYVTFKLAVEILEDEVEHETDLEAFLEDLEVVKKKCMK